MNLKCFLTETRLACMECHRDIHGSNNKCSLLDPFLSTELVGIPTDAIDTALGETFF